MTLEAFAYQSDMCLLQDSGTPGTPATMACVGGELVHQGLKTLADRTGPVHWTGSGVPGVNDDGAGNSATGITFEIGSRWKFGNRMFECATPGDGDAVWLEIAANAIECTSVVATANVSGKCLAATCDVTTGKLGGLCLPGDGATGCILCRDSNGYRWATPPAHQSSPAGATAACWDASCKMCAKTFWAQTNDDCMCLTRAVLKLYCGTQCSSTLGVRNLYFSDGAGTKSACYGLNSAYICAACCKLVLGRTGICMVDTCTALWHYSLGTGGTKLEVVSNGATMCFYNKGCNANHTGICAYGDLCMRSKCGTTTVCGKTSALVQSCGSVTMQSTTGCITLCSGKTKIVGICTSSPGGTGRIWSCNGCLMIT